MNPPVENTPAPSFLARRLERERRARIAAESLLEAKSLELHLTNQNLARLNADLEARVAERTLELEAARNAAEKASAAKSEFFAGISHEIRTPLNGVIGAAALLRDQIHEPAQVSLLDTIGASAELLLALVNDVLDFSQIEAGRMEFRPAPFDLAALVTRCGDLFVTAARAKGLLLAVEARLPAPTFVVGDALRLQQVLVNLLGNAVKFTRTGRVSLTVERLAAEGDRYGFEVHDTGPGLDDGQQERLFQPYAQAGVGPDDRAGGTGLGLVTAQRIVALAGGELQLSSAPGKGARFHFSLPLPAAPGATPEFALAIPGAAPNRPLRIVIADDVPTNLDILGLVLRRLGHTVSPHPDAASAIAEILQNPPDVAILDLQMPDTDGLAAARRLRTAGSPAATVKLIAFSADARVETTRSCIAAGFDACIHKPLRPALVAETLARLVQPPSKS